MRKKTSTFPNEDAIAKTNKVDFFAIKNTI